MQRASVRSARAWTQGGLAISVWDVGDSHLDGAIVRQRLEAVISGREHTAARLRPSKATDLEPSVQVRHDAPNRPP